MRFDCPFGCGCFFFTAHDLALHLTAFSDKGEAHKDAVRRLHEFVEEVGSECLNDDFTQVEYLTPEQIIAKIEFDIKSFCGLPIKKRKKFRRR